MKHAARRLYLGLLLAQLVVASGSCLPPVKPDRVRPATKATAPRVVVLKSSTNSYYQLPVDLFIAQIDATVTVFTATEGTSSMALVRAIAKRKPQLIFTLGTRATRLAREHFSDRPVLFSMVLNHQRLDLERVKTFMGIALETPPAAEFTKFKMVASKLSRVLTFYSQGASLGSVTAAREALKPLGVELVAVPVKDVAGVERAYRQHIKRVDGVWLLNDPVVMVRASFDFLRRQTVRDRVPFMCSLSDRFTREGALMSVSVDFHNLGSQAASMARMLLEAGKRPHEIGVQPPIGGKLTVNMHTARDIGLRVDPMIMPFISEVVAN